MNESNPILWAVIRVYDQMAANPIIASLLGMCVVAGVIVFLQMVEDTRRARRWAEEEHNAVLEAKNRANIIAAKKRRELNKGARRV